MPLQTIYMMLNGHANYIVLGMLVNACPILILYS